MDRSLTSILKGALIAGVLAGIIVASYHYVVTEPVLQRAIDAEEAFSASRPEPAGEHAHDDEEEIVTRGTQRTFGLFTGFFFYGVAWSLIAAAIYYPTQRFLPLASVTGRALSMAALLYWAVAFLPFMRYPANPPGVGDPGTIGHRQELFVGFLALSLLAAVVALLAGEAASRGMLSDGLKRYRALVVASVLVVSGAVLYLAFPPFTDPVNIAQSLVDSFRWRSLLGLTLFGAIFGAGFAFILGRSGEERATVKSPRLEASS